MKQNACFSVNFNLLGISLDQVNIFSETLPLLSYTHDPLNIEIIFKGWLV